MWSSILISLNDRDDVIARVTKHFFFTHEERTFLRAFYAFKVHHHHYFQHPSVFSLFVIVTVGASALHNCYWRVPWWYNPKLKHLLDVISTHFLPPKPPPWHRSHCSFSACAFLGSCTRAASLPKRNLDFALPLVPVAWRVITSLPLNLIDRRSQANRLYFSESYKTVEKVTNMSSELDLLRNQKFQHGLCLWLQQFEARFIQTSSWYTKHFQAKCTVRFTYAC